MLTLTAPARAEVVTSGPEEFTLGLSRTVSATPAAVFAMLATPAQWWSPAHTYSRDASNLSLDARAGGCFCERWPPGNSVEHGRVIMAMPGKLLRLSGGLGPLQQFPVAAVLTFTLTPAVGGTLITLSYAVAGRATGGLEPLAPAVDKVLSEQLGRLAQRLDAGPLKN